MVLIDIALKAVRDIDTTEQRDISGLVDHAVDDLKKAKAKLNDQLEGLPTDGGEPMRLTVRLIALEIDDIRGRLGSIA